MKKNISYSDLSVGFSHTAPRAESVIDDSHCHDRYEILYIVSGEGKYMVEGTEYPLHPRTLMFIRPFEYHCLMLDKNTDYSRYCIHFSQSALAPEAYKLLEDMSASDSSRGNYYSSAALPAVIDSVFDRFDTAEQLPEESRRIFMRALLTELVVILSSTSGEHHSADDGELGARVIKYLNSNIDKDVSLDKLARRFFVSKYYLCRAFKKHNGISVHGYVNHKRVMYAKQLIESGETASGAAYKVGFGDYSAFYRAYVRIIGKAPTQDERKDSNE